MRFRSSWYMLGAIGALLLCASVGVRGDHHEESAMKSVHLVNLSADAESTLAGLLNEFNEVISEIGHPGAGYSLWKKAGDGDGEYTHVWVGNWPNQKTYDAIHEHPKYMELVERHRPKLTTMTEDQVYQKYLEIVKP